MLRFCAKHGITANKETIWQLVQQFERRAAAVKMTYAPLAQSSSRPVQTSLPFGKPTRI